MISIDVNHYGGDIGINPNFDCNSSYWWILNLSTYYSIYNRTPTSTSVHDVWLTRKLDSHHNSRSDRIIFGDVFNPFSTTIQYLEQFADPGGGTTGGGTTGGGTTGGGNSAPLLYTSAFANTAIGDFPSSLEYKGGNVWIDDRLGVPMLRLERGGWFHVPLAADLPDRFSIEFDYRTDHPNGNLIVAAVDESSFSGAPGTSYRRGPFHFFTIARCCFEVSVSGGQNNLPSAEAGHEAFVNRVVPVRLEVDGRTARVYVDGEQVVMLPAATIVRSDRVEFAYTLGQGAGYVGNLVIRAE